MSVLKIKANLPGPQVKEKDSLFMNEEGKGIKG
jgi:hypothetical protein